MESWRVTESSDAKGERSENSLRQSQVSRQHQNKGRQEIKGSQTRNILEKNTTGVKKHKRENTKYTDNQKQREPDDRPESHDPCIYSV